jgi:hypothetical protein
MADAPSPEEFFTRSLTHLETRTDEELLELVVREVGTSGWTSTRGAYLGALRNVVCERFQLDTSWSLREIAAHLNLTVRSANEVPGVQYLGDWDASSSDD